jgi:secondary thiamine-phosphate synthase enzyme
MIEQQSFNIKTHSRGTYELTDKVQSITSGSGINTGLCHVFVHHTSASLMLCENADPAVRRDLETFMSRLAPDGHDIRTVVTQTGLTIPVVNGQCALGTWQGIFLWEHRTSGHSRRITVTVQGS